MFIVLQFFNTLRKSKEIVRARPYTARRELIIQQYFLNCFLGILRAKKNQLNLVNWRIANIFLTDFAENLFKEGLKYEYGASFVLNILLFCIQFFLY